MGADECAVVTTSRDGNTIATVNMLSSDDCDTILCVLSSVLLWGSVTRQGYFDQAKSIVTHITKQNRNTTTLN